MQYKVNSPSTKAFSNNTLNVKQENTAVKINHTSKPLNLAPFREHDVVIVKEQKRVPRLYNGNKTMIAIKDSSKLDSVRAALIMDLKIECTHDPESNACQVLYKMIEGNSRPVYVDRLPS